jgi:hypothetical protein
VEVVLVAYRSMGWKTQYEIDFSAQSNLNIKTGGNGTKSIGGKDWTWANDADATAANVTNGTGIVVNPVANSGSASPASRSGSLLSIGLTSLLPLTLNVARHIVRIEARVLLTGATLDAQGVRLGLEDAAAPTDQAISLFKGFAAVAGSASQFISQSSKPTATSALTIGDTTNFTDDVLVLDVEFPDLWSSRTGSYSGGFSNSHVYPHFRAGEILDSGTPSALWRLQAQPRVVLAWQDSNGGGGAFTGTFTHLRVSQINKWPA